MHHLFTRILLVCVVAVAGAAIGVKAVAPVPGTYDPVTMTFYENGLKVPIVQEEAGTVNKTLTRSTLNTIVLLQCASDQTWTYPSSDFDDMLFTDHTYATGSMRDYYEEVSYGQLMLEGTVAGWYTAANTYAYYTGGNYGFDPDGHATEFIREAIQNADTDVDFALFDNDGDGVVEGLIVVHQGPGGEGGNPNQFWSHKGWLSPPEQVDGVEISEYNLDPERKPHGPIETIGVFCHEFGHTLGAPDLYDTDYTPGCDPVGRYGVMCSGSYNGQPAGANPAHFMAWNKVLFGWLEPTIIVAPQNGLPLVDVKMINNAQACYRLPIANSPDEHFLVENRWVDSPAYFDQRGTGYDSGALLTHCHDNGSSANEPFHCFLRDPDPDHPDHKNAAYCAEDGQTECTPYTAVDSDGYYLPSGIYFKNFSTSGANMTFDVDLKPVFIYNHMDLTVPQSGGEYQMAVTVQNKAYNATNITATLSCSSSQVTITKASANYPDIANDATGANTTDTFTYTVNGSGPKGEIAVFTLNFSANSVNLDYTPVSFAVIVNTSPILFVDDDQNQRWVPEAMEVYFTEALDGTGYDYDVWENAAYLSHPEYANLQQYDIVVWNTGSGYNKAISEEEQVTLGQYLDAGGYLFISSQEYLYQEYGYPDGEDWVAATVPGEFAHDYLHIASLEQDEYYYHVFGVADCPLTTGMNVALTDHISDDPTGSSIETGGYDWWPDNILPDATAQAIFTAESHNYPTGMHPDYFETGTDEIVEGPCALMYPKPGTTADYKVIFLAFSFEGMPLTDRVTLLTNSINWFNGAMTDGISLQINQNMFTSGDQFVLGATIRNTNATPVTVDEYIVLDIWGTAYYFWPSWTMDLEFNTTNLNAYESRSQAVLSFPWPDGAGEADDIKFWGALLHTGTIEVFGDFDYVSFGWN
ncbi:M6 family metalloprotease domain-containing protein [bacterium]|nr:M6 family metalloprotease domain-containing protein [candidate division CSSED10-310 bacterium]